MAESNDNKHTWGDEGFSRCGEPLSFLDGYSGAESTCIECLHGILGDYIESRRDQLAMAALTGLLANRGILPGDNSVIQAHYAYQLADAMLIARKEK